MDRLSRREFQQHTLGALLTWSLLDTLFAREAFSDEVKLIARDWLNELNTMGHDLRGQKLAPLVWQKQVEELFSRVDVPELMRFIDFDKLTKNVTPKDRGELSLRATLPKVEGLPTDLVFGHQVFALNQGRSVVPHGHDNMATAFIILKGEFHGRHYDRLEDAGKEHMIIRPTLDKQFGVGGYSTVTDLKDNVHWFKATSDVGYIFNIHVLSVKPGRSGRVYVDPEGEKLSGDRIKARVINHEEANKLYG
ncbi:MAG: hypothetical protein DWH91_03905 [Planctomycetota bacterium]|nr:MAG: hypothetical protein DWH91_03905 [Planctomycetota bacterium]